ncbi:MAG: TIGR01212 family radical SAM protein [bacterium]
MYLISQYLKDTFGEKVRKISLDAGFTCPNIDGTLSNKGCIYCNNKAFSLYTRERKDIKTQIIESIGYYKKRGVNKFLAYFQAFSNTYGPLERLKEAYDNIKGFKEIVGLVISTRPDCVNEEKIRLIAEYKNDYLTWIEYGLQTTHNHTLKAINRNHTYEDFLKALELTKEYQINVGVHIIIGLLGEGYDEMMTSASRLSSLPIDGIKFHLLHILKDTELETMYYQEKIRLLEMDEYVKIICDFLEKIPKNVVILRLISDAKPEYLIAPKWMNNKGVVISKINKELEKKWQIKLKNQCNYLTFP